MLNTSALFAQEKVVFTQEYIPTEHEQELLDDADFFFTQKNYLRALTAYKQLYELYPGGTGYGYKLGICYLYKTDEREKAIGLIEAAQEAGETDPDLLYYLGRAYHINQKFDEAIATFNKYLESNLLGRKKEKEAKTYIDYCNNGKELVKDPQDMNIRNIGVPVNTASSEYVPVISGDGSVLIYTYRGERSIGGLQNGKLEPDSSGEYYEDVFVSYRLGNTWSKPEGLSNINTKGHDACIALSPDGRILFLYKSTMKDKGDVYVSRLEGEKWSDPVRLEGINTNNWEGSVSITADGKTLYFSSDRPGGYGGKDIYRAELMSDGTWGNIKNVGAEVNTSLDEDAPFIHADGRLLHFSSQAHTSMGGYDVFVTSYDGRSFTKPKNIGYPVNSTGDDIYYVINAEGTEGYYASTTKGGYGEQDIYVVNPGLSHGLKPSLMVVKGKVTVDGKPAEAKITLRIKGNNDPQGRYDSQIGTGNYSVPLPPGFEYSIAYDVKGFATHIEEVNAMKVDTFTEKIIDVALGTPVAAKTDPVVSKLKVQRVFFDFDEYDLDAQYTAYAENVFNILSQNKDFTVEVAGNTDNLGSDQYNYNLSKLRAQTVANYLVGKGIDKSRIKMIFNGESKPVAANQNADGSDNADGRAKNRRVEFRINTGSSNAEIIYEDNSPVKPIYSAVQINEQNIQ